MSTRSRIALAALLVALLAGCVVTPTRYHAPIGDFVTNIGSSAGRLSTVDGRQADSA